MTIPRIVTATLVALALVLTACGGDDPGPSDAGSEPGGSATGIGATDDPLIKTAVADYQEYALGQVDETIAKAKVLTDAVRAGDVEAAKAAYAPSRQGWESMEPLAGLVEEIDGKVDARVDDFEGEDDPGFTGWHRLEYLLFAKNTTDGAAKVADQLDADLQTLKAELAKLEVPPATLPVGASELIEEVSTGKLTGEEDRYSGTDLWDFAANVAGSKKAIELLTPALQEKDPALLATIQQQFATIDGLLAKYEDGSGGWKSYSTLTADDKAAMQAALGQLSESLSQVAGALGLE